MGFPWDKTVLPAGSVQDRHGLVFVGSHGEKVHHFLNSPSSFQEKASVGT